MRTDKMEWLSSLIGLGIAVAYAALTWQESPGMAIFVLCVGMLCILATVEGHFAQGGHDEG